MKSENRFHFSEERNGVVPAIQHGCHANPILYVYDRIYWAYFVIFALLALGICLYWNFAKTIICISVMQYTIFVDSIIVYFIPVILIYKLIRALAFLQACSVVFLHALSFFFTCFVVFLHVLCHFSSRALSFFFTCFVMFLRVLCRFPSRALSFFFTCFVVFLHVLCMFLRALSFFSWRALPFSFVYCILFLRTLAFAFAWYVLYLRALLFDSRITLEQDLGVLVLDDLR